MSVLYVFTGLIVVAAAVFVVIGVGMLTKYLLRDQSYYKPDDEVPNSILGAFVLAVLSIVIGLVVALSYTIGESVINALNK